MYYVNIGGNMSYKSIIGEYNQMPIGNKTGTLCVSKIISISLVSEEENKFFI
jgi:hypothetical protein